MKRFHLLLIAAVFFCLSGCGGAVTPPVDEPDEPQLASVVINLSWSDESVTGPISLAEVKEYTNRYDIYFRDVSDGSLTSFIELTDLTKAELEIKEGIYDILILTGYRPGGYDPLLLASTYAEGKSIISGAANEFDLVFETFEVSLICPETVFVGEVIDVHVVINTKNPLILLYPPEPYYDGFVSTGAYPIFRSFLLTHYIKDGNVWTLYDGGQTIYAPETSASWPTMFNMSYKPLNIISANAWKLAYRAYPVFGDYFYSVIEIIEPEE